MDDFGNQYLVRLDLDDVCHNCGQKMVVVYPALAVVPALAGIDVGRLARALTVTVGIEHPLGAFVHLTMAQKIAAFYIEAARLTQESGIPHEVDHIIPIQHELVCGLHVPANLQVITRFLNRSKRNGFEVGPFAF